MKIALIKQKTSYDFPCDSNLYGNKLVRTMKETGANIVVGPELAISNGFMPINEIEFNLFNEKIRRNLNNGNLIIPGTALVFNKNEKYLKNVAPIITKKGITYFNKKSSINEDLIAKASGLDYKTGEDNEGILEYDNKLLGVEICRDHGMGKLRNSIDKKLDFQFVLACGLDGISPDKCIVKDNGIIGFNNGKARDSKPEVYVVRKKEDSYEFIDGEETEDYFLVENV